MFLVTRWAKWRPYRSCFVSGQNCHDISVNKSLNVPRSLHNTSILTKYLLPDISDKNTKYGNVCSIYTSKSYTIAYNIYFTVPNFFILYFTVEYKIVSELLNEHKSETTDGNFKLKFNFSFVV